MSITTTVKIIQYHKKQGKIKPALTGISEIRIGKQSGCNSKHSFQARRVKFGK